MDISVIVVTYNQERTIGRTLDSILSQQTDADYEIVIGDDCSTDGTEAVCRDYAARYPGRIRYLRRERNLGLVANYYDCIANSRGRYLADCAGDDYWVDTSKLQRQFEVLESRPDVTLVATDWLCRDDATGRLSRVGNECPPGEYSPGELVVPLLIHSKVVHLCSALYRKATLTEAIRRNQHIFLDSRYIAEDIQILLNAASSGTVVVLPAVTLHYSVGHPSVSNRPDFKGKFMQARLNLRQLRRLQRFFVPSPMASERKKLQTFYLRELRYIIAMACKALLFR